MPHPLAEQSVTLSQLQRDASVSPTTTKPPTQGTGTSTETASEFCESAEASFGTLASSSVLEEQERNGPTSYFGHSAQPMSPVSASPDVSVVAVRGSEPCTPVREAIREAQSPRDDDSIVPPPGPKTRAPTLDDEVRTSIDRLQEQEQEKGQVAEEEQWVEVPPHPNVVKQDAVVCVVVDFGAVAHAAQEHEGMPAAPKQGAVGALQALGKLGFEVHIIVGSEGDEEAAAQRADAEKWLADREVQVRGVHGLGQKAEAGQGEVLKLIEELKASLFLTSDMAMLDLLPTPISCVFLGGDAASDASLASEPQDGITLVASWADAVEAIVKLSKVAS